MTRISGDSEFDRDWDAVRSNGDIQFAPVDLPQEVPDPPPEWLVDFLRLLGDLFSPLAGWIGDSWQAMLWALVAIVAALVFVGLYRWLQLRASSASDGNDDEAGWVPDKAEALRLLEDADRLAQEGRFDEAVHLLLQRSVGQIAQASPDLIEPSSTAREIAVLPALPEAARSAFATIAERVERSLFALTRLDSEDWQVARSAYSQFALGYERGYT